MALYLGSKKKNLRIYMTKELWNLSIGSYNPPKEKRPKLRSFDNLILKDINGLTLLPKEVN